jgi:hypothetical protein
LVIRPWFAGAAAGLADLGVQPEIGDEPVRVLEAGEVADRGDDRHRHAHVDAGHRHQPGDDRVVDRFDGDVALDVGELVAVEVELAQQCFH